MSRRKADPPWWWKPWLAPWFAARAWWYRARPVRGRHHRPASMLQPFTFDDSDDESGLKRVKLRPVTPEEEEQQNNW